MESPSGTASLLGAPDSAANHAAPDVEQPSQPETCGFSAEAFARFMLMALALAARVKDFTYLDPLDGQTYTGIEALARVERDETLRKLSIQRPEYQRLKRWYIIMGLATVDGFDGAATFFDSCMWLVGKDGDGERHCDATSQFYRRNVMWIVPLLAKSGAVAVCEAYLSVVMDLCVEGEPGTNSHKCVAQNAAAGCSTEWNKVHRVEQSARCLQTRPGIARTRQGSWWIKSGSPASLWRHRTRVGSLPRGSSWSWSERQGNSRGASESARKRAPVRERAAHPACEKGAADLLARTPAGAQRRGGCRCAAGPCGRAMEQGSGARSVPVLYTAVRTITSVCFFRSVGLPSTSDCKIKRHTPRLYTLSRTPSARRHWDAMEDKLHADGCV